MDESHTLNAFVQFIYRDMPDGNEIATTTRLLQNNANLKGIYSEMLASRTQLPKVLFNPSTESLNKILQYSAKSALEPVS